MYVRKKNEEAVSPVIAVILMVAITVVLAGVLYVWVTSLANTEDQSTTLRLTISDASATVNSEGSNFPAGTQLLKIEQSGGDPVNWKELTVYGNEKDSDVRVALAIDTINGQAYSATTNYQSKAGQIILLEVVGGTDFQGGDYVVMNIFKGEDKVFTSTAIRCV